LSQGGVMLDLAYPHRTNLQNRFLTALKLPINRWYYTEPIQQYELPIDQNDWMRIQYVSLHSDRSLIGYLCADINRYQNMIDNVSILPYENNSQFTFFCDILRFIDIIFYERKFRKAMIKVLEINPVRNLFERMIVSTGVGSFVGNMKEHSMLLDGNCYNHCLYEVYRSEYNKYRGLNPIRK
jgi:hypothetical protein